MNRNQAEHILDAYVTIKSAQWDKDAEEALREVILDAMATPSNSSGITYPRITMPGITVPNVTTPTITKPIVTCDVGGAQ